MKAVLVATDSAEVLADVSAVLPSGEYTVHPVARGEAVLATVRAGTPDLVVCDFQIGNMGGMAVTLEIRLDESVGRIDHVPVLLLLDRRPDVFLARRSGADGFLVKPLDPIRLRRAVAAVLSGAGFEDEAYRPPATAAGLPTA